MTVLARGKHAGNEWRGGLSSKRGDGLAAAIKPGLRCKDIFFPVGRSLLSGDPAELGLQLVDSVADNGTPSSDV
jgi:hypothetical protein